MGKESDVYLVNNEAGEELCLKLHRLGRTSFRQIKNKRDYHRHRNNTSWLYMSRIAAEIEFTFMKALRDNGFPVPIPVAYSRHAVLMSVAEGIPMTQMEELSDPAELCEKMMDFIRRLASFGLIHCDLNEFNALVSDEDDDELELTVIDFPQMVSTSHKNAKYYFDRDVSGCRDFFAKKFGYICPELPDLEKIERVGHLDIELKASGYNHDEKYANIDGEEKFISNNIGELPDVAEGEEGSTSDVEEETDSENEEDIETVEDETETPGTKTALENIRSIVRKQVRKQFVKKSNRVILQSAQAGRKKRNNDRASNLCTEDFFVKLLND